MSQNFERAQSRLNNIKAIEPLLSALRTISMGNWRVAQRKIADMKEYEKNFSHILMEVLPHIEDTKSPNRSRETIKTSIADTIVLIVGSERGLCGNFNETLAERADQWIKSQNLPSHKVWGLGSRMIQTLEKMNIDLSWRNPLPSGNLVSYQQSYELTQNWLDQYERYNFNRLYVLFNQLEKGGSYHFAAFSLLPYEIQHPTISVVEHERKRWPPPIIETDPKGIYHQIIRYFLASSFYQILLRSAAAEHAARFRLME
ncbi:MAG: F0F1 ATP synthase subunit gamma, partial [Chloroflexota bacterium]|nr:F0F1 ATP synthase subunit gamma [Chloroflexota bacterium]